MLSQPPANVMTKIPYIVKPIRTPVSNVQKVQIGNSIEPKSRLELAFIKKIRVHEKFDPERTEPLIRQLKQDQIQKHPVIAVEGPNNELVHLDGANRIASLKQLDCPYILTQVIDYKQRDTLELKTWAHTNQISRCELFQLYKDSLIKVKSDEALKALENYQTPFAIWFSNLEAYIMRSSMGLFDIVKGWEKVTDLYRKKTNRVILPNHGQTQAVNDLVSGSDGYNACVAFVPISVEDVIYITCKMGLKIPAGITRIKVLCGRDTYVNFPLACLRTYTSAKYRNNLLKNHLKDRIKRPYSEPVNIYEIVS